MMMQRNKVSIFTPTHDSRWLLELYDSIKDQPFHEWVVVYNNGAEVVEIQDPRYRPFVVNDAPEYVGWLKHYACERCTGHILLELDHDDLLMPGAIEAVIEAFRSPEVGFVYSNAIHCTDKFEAVQKYDKQYGWQYRETFYVKHHLTEYVSFPPTPNSVSKIWYAPNHLRAFCKQAYKKAGGYNQEMRILDDQDLMCRLYSVAKFKHIDQALYIYRVHGANSWLKYNAEIQQNVYRIYDQYIEGMCLKWADMNGLRKLDLGGAIDGHPEYEIVDQNGGDVKCDLNERWPFADDSVGVIRAYDIFEHLRDPLHTMKDLYRVLAPGGYALIMVPSTDGRGAFQDPTHVSYWNENSFLYYTDQSKARYIGTPVRFQAMRLYTTPMNDQQVCWTVAHLTKLTASMRAPGLVKI